MATLTKLSEVRHRAFYGSGAVQMLSAGAAKQAVEIRVGGIKIDQKKFKISFVTVRKDEQ
jgi:hypothetical protein